MKSKSPQTRRYSASGGFFTAKIRHGKSSRRKFKKEQPLAEYPLRESAVRAKHLIRGIGETGFPFYLPLDERSRG